MSTDRSSVHGNPTNALFGLVRALRRAIEFREPNVAVAVVDAHASTAWPAALASQAKRMPTILETLGFHIIVSETPANAVAGYTHAALEEGFDVVVVGSDKRFAQLVSEKVWWYDAYKHVRYTPELVRKRFEVGPAYVFLLAEALTEAAMREGLPRDVAENFVHQTIRGAGHLLTDTSKSPARLRYEVTSPGGTTAAAMHVLEEKGFRAVVEDAVRAAAIRARELGGES